MLMNPLLHRMWSLKVLGERCFHHQGVGLVSVSSLKLVQNFTARWKHGLTTFCCSVVQRLNHVRWHYKQDKLRQRTPSICAPGMESDRWGRGTVTFHFHGPWNRLSAGMLVSSLVSPACHVKAAANKERMPIMSCEKGDVTFQAQLDVLHVLWRTSR